MKHALSSTLEGAVASYITGAWHSVAQGARQECVILS